MARRGRACAGACVGFFQSLALRLVGVQERPGSVSWLAYVGGGRKYRPADRAEDAATAVGDRGRPLMAQPWDSSDDAFEGVRGSRAETLPTVFVFPTDATTWDIMSIDP